MTLAFYMIFRYMQHSCINAADEEKPTEVGQVLMVTDGDALSGCKVQACVMCARVYTYQMENPSPSVTHGQKPLDAA